MKKTRKAKEVEKMSEENLTGLDGDFPHVMTKRAKANPMECNDIKRKETKEKKTKLN